MSYKITSYQDIPENTPLEAIPKLASRVQEGFRSFKTLPLEFRKQQLRNLYYALYDNQETLYETVKLDLNKSKHETDLTEIYWLLTEILYFINNLEKLAAPQHSGNNGLTHLTSNTEIQKHPLGTVLVISPWNYPIILSISPLAAALAAGNSVVLKLSEISSNTSRALAKILESALDPEIFAAVTGDVPQSTALLKQKWDKIIYTGNGVVGRIIARAAAENLTPTLLELGGKSPVIVTKTANLRIAAKRVLWGKQVNSGQTCVAPDYILVDKTVKAQFIEEIKKVYVEFGWDLDNTIPAEVEAKDHGNYSRIVNEKHFGRLKKYLDTTGGDVVIGGHSHIDEKSRYFAPTVIDNVTATDSLMKEEIFGALIGLVEYSTLNEAIDFIRELHDTPLALYIFSGDKKEQQYILDHTRSGGVSINDTLMHVGILHAPFGGVGESGMGGYHGVYGFDSFSHFRTVLSQSPSSVAEMLIATRYPPYTTEKNQQIVKLTKPPAHPRGIPRTGKVTGSSWGVPSGSYLASVFDFAFSKNGLLAILAVGVVVSNLKYLGW